jgi:hypothetical protein
VLDLRTTVVVIVAIAALVVPAAFLGLILAAASRRRTGHALGPRWTGTVALVGGASLGTMFLVIADNLLIASPLILTAVLVAAGQWRSGHRALAALVVAGATLPWTVLWAAYLGLLVTGVAAFDRGATLVGLAAGAIPTAAALAVAVHFPQVPAGAGGPTGRGVPRSFNTIGEAMREPSRIGPFGMSELAALVVLVGAGLLLLAGAMAGLPAIVGYGLAVFAGSALATEAWMRAMAMRTRRSMEAFMWLGEWDVAQAKVLTGGGVPTSRAGAEQWLARHPATAGEPVIVQALRVELSLLAGRVREARPLVESLPDGTPDERFTRLALADLVAWWTAEGDRLEDMATALTEIVPPDGEERLRAEVTLAIARARHLAVVDPPVDDPLVPLLAVRERLGARADGIVRRIFWPRLYRVFLVGTALFALVTLAFGLPQGLR